MYTYIYIYTIMYNIDIHVYTYTKARLLLCELYSLAERGPISIFCYCEDDLTPKLIVRHGYFCTSFLVELPYYERVETYYGMDMTISRSTDRDERKTEQPGLGESSQCISMIVPVSDFSSFAE